MGSGATALRRAIFAAAAFMAVVAACLGAATLPFAPAHAVPPSASLLASPSTAPAQTPSPTPAPTAPPSTPAPAPAPIPFRVEAPAAYLLDAVTGQELLAQDASRSLDPASLVKMMTLRLAYRDLARRRATLEDRVKVSAKAWRTGGSRMFIEPGKDVRLADLLLGIAVVSGNDACVALAEHLAGSEEAFVAEMNAEAERLGLTGTHFVNTHGITEPGQTTTARDAAVLGGRLVTDYPDSLAALSTQEFTYSGITQPNRNGLLFTDPSVDGIKTGHTEQAGYNLVATARRDSMRLVAVVMGAVDEPVREKATAGLLDYGFRNFATVALASPGQALGRIRVYKGRQNWVEVTPAQLLAVTVPRGQEETVRRSLSLQAHLVAPVRDGQKAGEVVARRGQEVVVRVPALAASTVSRGNWFKVALDSVRLFFRGAVQRQAPAPRAGG